MIFVRLSAKGPVISKVISVCTPFASTSSKAAIGNAPPSDILIVNVPGAYLGKTVKCNSVADEKSIVLVTVPV